MSDRYALAILQILSLCTEESPKVPTYKSDIADVEATLLGWCGETICGSISAEYGTSMYDFHSKYPIDGQGVRKDLFKVVNSAGSRNALFGLCHENSVVAYYNRCGKDITYEVAFGCHP